MFNNSVNNCDLIRNCLKVGLRAMGANSNFISVSNTSKLNGSINLDRCLFKQNIDLNSNRWDYIIGYNNMAYFIEVHPASTTEVPIILKKLEWLKIWLMNNASSLNEIKGHPAFHWAATGKISVLTNSRYAKQLAKAGIQMPKSRIIISE